MHGQDEAMFLPSKSLKYLLVLEKAHGMIEQLSKVSDATKRNIFLAGMGFLELL